MTDYSGAIFALIAITSVLTAAVVFVLAQPTDLPVVKKAQGWRASSSNLYSPKQWTRKTFSFSPSASAPLVLLWISTRWTAWLSTSPITFWVSILVVEFQKGSFMTSDSLDWLKNSISNIHQNNISIFLILHIFEQYFQHNVVPLFIYWLSQLFTRYSRSDACRLSGRACRHTAKTVSVHSLLVWYDLLPLSFVFNGRALIARSAALRNHCGIDAREPPPWSD